MSKNLLHITFSCYADPLGQGAGISGGARVRLANTVLAKAYLRCMNGVTIAGRALGVEPATEFGLKVVPNRGILGDQRFFNHVWRRCHESPRAPGMDVYVRGLVLRGQA